MRPDACGGGWYHLGQVALPGMRSRGRRLHAGGAQEMGSGAGSRVWGDTGSQKRVSSSGSNLLGGGARQVRFDIVVMSDLFRGPRACPTTTCRHPRWDCVVPAPVGLLV